MRSTGGGLSKTRLGRVGEVMGGYVKRGEVPGVVAWSPAARHMQNPPNGAPLPGTGGSLDRAAVSKRCDANPTFEHVRR